MEREICPVCAKRVSNWQIANGKTIVANGNTYHRGCLDELTIKQMEAISAKANQPVRQG